MLTCLKKVAHTGVCNFCIKVILVLDLYCFQTFVRLNGKPLRIVSGAIHYFRVHPEYWRDRLKKLRAMGANTVETYMPWQLHEPKKGTFDFGQGGNDMSMFLDFERFLRIAKEEDLLALIRPGPYICSEWDFGGFPRYAFVVFYI